MSSHLAKSETLMVTRGKKGEVTHFALFLREFVSDCSSDSTAMKYEYSVKSVSENEYTLVVDDVKADYAASLYSQYKCEEGFPGQYSSVKFMKCYENDVDVFESARREIGASVTMKVVFEKCLGLAYSYVQNEADAVVFVEVAAYIAILKSVCL